MKFSDLFTPIADAVVEGLRIVRIGTSPTFTREDNNRRE